MNGEIKKISKSSSIKILSNAHKSFNKQTIALIHLISILKQMH